MKLKLLIFSLFFISTIFGQEKLNLDLGSSCSFDGKPITGEVYGFASSSEAVSIIDEIVNLIGLKRNFNIQAGSVPNAAAVIQGSERYILYSQNFMTHIINESNSYWAAIGIMAHEVAHHLNGHTLQGGSRPPTELEADEFAGFIMYKMGATFKQAQKMFNNRTLYQPYDSPTHPATSARLEAVAVGYQKAKEKSGYRGNSSPLNIPSQNNNSSVNYPNSNSDKNYPYTNTSSEGLGKQDYQIFTANLAGQNLELMITKNKELNHIISKSPQPDGKYKIEIAPYYFEFFRKGSLAGLHSDAYILNFNSKDFYNNEVITYAVIISPDNKITIGCMINGEEKGVELGTLKFNWFKN